MIENSVYKWRLNFEFLIQIRSFHRGLLTLSKLTLSKLTLSKLTLSKLTLSKLALSKSLKMIEKEVADHFGKILGGQNGAERGPKGGGGGAGLEMRGLTNGDLGSVKG
jgi:hypothetical protein